MSSNMENILLLLGAFSAVSLTLKTLSLARLYLSPSSLSLRRWNHGSDPYVLITGATDGIGLGFVEAFAARKFNIILLARNKDKLEARRQELQKQFPKQKFEVLVFNALSDSYDGIEQLVASIAHLNVTILVNNIGGIPFMPGYISLTEHTPQQIDNVINLNARFLVHFTHHMVPILQKHSPALIMNIGSAAKHGLPFATIYSATKGFVLSFSEALNREFKVTKTPIDVLDIDLGDVSSKQTPTPVHLLNPAAKVFSDITVGRVGATVAAGRNFVTPWIPHAVLVSVLSILPEFMQITMLGNMIREAQKLHLKIFKKEFSESKSFDR